MIGSFHTRLKLSIDGNALGKNVNEKSYAERFLTALIAKIDPGMR